MSTPTHDSTPPAREAGLALYQVESGDEMFASNTNGECFFDTGTVGARLEKDHEAACTTVTHPEP